MLNCGQQIKLNILIIYHKEYIKMSNSMKFDESFHSDESAGNTHDKERLRALAYEMYLNIRDMIIVEDNLDKDTIIPATRIMEKFNNICKEIDQK